MKIAYFMPFKPLGHPRPSGDLMIGTELFEYLAHRGHDIRLASRRRCRWVFWKPWLWPVLATEAARILHRSRKWSPDLWLSYHSYYKAPDLLGPACSRMMGVPYVIFQGVFSTKQQRRAVARPGFYLNRRSLMSADAVITNKNRDHLNLRRLIPPDRLHYVRPGIRLNSFAPDLEARAELRTQWQAGLKPVILTAAMFRPDVKTAGVLQVIDSCRTLQQEGVDYLLVIVGDGSEKDVIRSAAQQRIAGHFIMTGRVPRHLLPNLFSAADLFAFPGVNEGLGMVYLEAQACGLPVVALRNWGASEAVIHMETGLLAPAENPDGFTDGIRVLAQHKALRETMGSAARRHIVRHHDMNRNYEAVEHILKAARASVPVRAR